MRVRARSEQVRFEFGAVRFDRFGSSSFRIRFSAVQVRFDFGLGSVRVQFELGASSIGSVRVLFCSSGRVLLVFGSGSLREAPSGHPQDWRCCLGEVDVQEKEAAIYSFITLEFG